MLLCLLGKPVGWVVPKDERPRLLLILPLDPEEAFEWGARVPGIDARPPHPCQRRKPLRQIVDQDNRLCLFTYVINKRRFGSRVNTNYLVLVYELLIGGKRLRASAPRSFTIRS